MLPSFVNLNALESKLLIICVKRELSPTICLIFQIQIHNKVFILSLCLVIEQFCTVHDTITQTKNIFVQCNITMFRKREISKISLIKSINCLLEILIFDKYSSIFSRFLALIFCQFRKPYNSIQWRSHIM